MELPAKLPGVTLLQGEPLNSVIVGCSRPLAGTSNHSRSHASLGHNMHAACVNSPQAAERHTYCALLLCLWQSWHPSTIQHLPPSMLAVNINPIDVWVQSCRVGGHHWVVTGLVLATDSLLHACRLFPEPWWAAELGHRPSSWWLQHIDSRRLQELPAGQRVGLLNSVADLVKHLGHKLVPFLPELASVVLLLLQGGCQPLHMPQVRERMEVFLGDMDQS